MGRKERRQQRRQSRERGGEEKRGKEGLMMM